MKIGTATFFVRQKTFFDLIKKVAVPILIFSGAVVFAETDTSTDKQYVIEAGDILSIIVRPAEELSKETVIVSPDYKVVMPLIGEIVVKDLTATKLEQEITRLLRKYVTEPKVNVVVKTFASRKVYITGQITRPGEYNYQDELKFFELVSRAGDFTDKAVISDIKLYRGKGDSRQIFTIDADKLKKEGKDVVLQIGDVIDIPKIKGDVFLLGEVSRQGVYPYKEGQKLLELITLAGGFTKDAEISNVTIMRETSKGKEVIPVNMELILSGVASNSPVLKPGDYVYVPKTALSTWNFITSNILPTVTFIASIVTFYYLVIKK